MPTSTSGEDGGQPPPDEPPDTPLDVLAGASENGGSADTSFGIERARDTTIRVLETMTGRGRSGRPIQGLPTGFSRVDAIACGMNPGDLVIVGSRPAVGKTSFAMNVAINAAHSRLSKHDSGAVLVFSLELDKEQLVTRMLASEGRVDLARLRAGRVHRDDWVALAQASATLSDLPLFIDDTPEVTLAYMRDRIRIMQQGPGLALVVVDYVQLIRPEMRGETREREATEISRKLKLMARRFRVPILAVSQMNRALESRGVKDKRPILADLRDTGALEEDADLVLLLYRDEVYHKETIDVGIAEVIVAKQRGGPTGTAKLRFFAQYNRFDNLIDENPAD